MVHFTRKIKVNVSFDTMNGVDFVCQYGTNKQKSFIPVHQIKYASTVYIFNK